MNKRDLGIIFVYFISLIISFSMVIGVISVENNPQIIDIGLEDSLYVADTEGIKRYPLLNRFSNEIYLPKDWDPDFEHAQERITDIDVVYTNDVVCSIEDYGLLSIRFDFYDELQSVREYETLWGNYGVVAYGLNEIILANAVWGLYSFYVFSFDNLVLDWSLLEDKYEASHVRILYDRDCVVGIDNDSFYIVNYSSSVRDIVGEISGFSYSIDSLHYIYGMAPYKELILTVSEEDGFHIFDVSDVLNPQEVYHLEGSYKDVTFGWWSYDYNNVILTGQSGIKILEMDDPTNPILIAEHTTSQNIEQVAYDFNNQIIYTSNQQGDLILYDLNDPYNPQLIMVYKSFPYWIIIVIMIIVIIPVIVIFVIRRNKKKSIEIPRETIIPKIQETKIINKELEETQTDVDTRTESIFCWNCGHANKPFKKFCNSCGEKLLKK